MRTDARPLLLIALLAACGHSSAEAPEPVDALVEAPADTRKDVVPADTKRGGTYPDGAPFGTLQDGAVVECCPPTDPPTCDCVWLGGSRTFTGSCPGLKACNVMPDRFLLDHDDNGCPKWVVPIPTPCGGP